MISLEGVYDLHVHTAPDCIPRKLDDEELVLRQIAAGMGGCVLKCHAAPTAGRAAIMKKRYPEFDTQGSITLNRSVGGINPEAVEAAAKMGARYVWFPTMDARAYRESQGRPCDGSELTIEDENGSLKKEVLEVLAIAKEYDLVVGTGHIGTAAAIRLVLEAHSMGLKRICVTHVTLPVCRMTLPELELVVQEGAMLEYSYCHILSGKCRMEEAAGQIRHIGAKHVILSSDLGQTGNPYPDEGLKQFADLLMEEGIREEELMQMMRENPKKLLYA